MIQVDNVENPFHEEDPRFPVWETLKRSRSGPLGQEEAKAVVQQYQGLMEFTFALFREMIQSKNRLTVDALPFLTKKTGVAETEEGLSKITEEWDQFLDLMGTVYLLRSLEAAGNVDKPFTVQIQNREDKEVANAGIVS